jgi:AraC-like DNA-binding protein
MIHSVEATRLAKRSGVPAGNRQNPAEVAVLLNDAKAALLSDRAFARACVARALDLLLLTAEDSVCQISLACGMCDQAHLTRVFRRVVGESPTAWRRLHAVGPAPSPAISSETR